MRRATCKRFVTMAFAALLIALFPSGIAKAAQPLSNGAAVPSASESEAAEPSTDDAAVSATTSAAVPTLSLIHI